MPSSRRGPTAGSIPQPVGLVDELGFRVGTDAAPMAMKLGTNDMNNDVWGVPYVSLPCSLLHGLFTFDIPDHIWLVYENGVEITPPPASTAITSVNGHAKLLTTATETVLRLESRECPRYQPNRGHKFSTAGWFPNKLNDCTRDFGLQTAENGVYFRLKADGNLYAVLKSGGVERFEELIDMTGLPTFDVEKGNVYDIQYQWRGVGNYYFYVNLQLVHVFNLLGNYAEISIENPALPVCYKATRGTQEAEMHIGCADITSENGAADKEVYSSLYAEAVATGTNKPLLVMYQPLLINGTTNTRTVTLARISCKNTKKQTFKVWTTRDPTAIVGGTFAPIGEGSFVECDSPDTSPVAVRSTSVDLTKLHYVMSMPLEANVENLKDNPYRGRIEFPFVRGDYLVITSESGASTAELVIEIGEQI